MRVAIATCSAVPPQFDDDLRLAAALARLEVESKREVWDDGLVDWSSYDRVVIRSTWDYPHKYDAFLEWVDRLDGRIHNTPAVVRWNSDKRHLADLADAGLPVVETTFIDLGDGIPPLEGEVVVKPTVSVGAGSTGRFGPGSQELAERLVARLHREGRAAMVQPYLPSVDSSGETALVYVAGRFSHALRKGQVLRPDEEAPVRDDGLRAAEAMYDPGLVSSSSATEAQRAVASAVLAYVAERFGEAPLYARVDLVEDPQRGPVLLELEAVEPGMYLGLARGSAERFASAVAGS